MATVDTEVRDGALIVTINRPDARNAIDQETAEALAAAFRRLDGDSELAVGILCGAGGTFCAGMDLKYYAATGRVPTVGKDGFAGLTRATIGKPLIAAVEGWALGGGFEIVLAFDLIVAAESACFGLPEPKRGLMAGEGGVLRLPRRLPHHVAMELLLTGEPLTAARAASFGLVNRLVPAGAALEAACDLAATLRRNGPLALASIKRAVHATMAEHAGFAEQDRISERLQASEDAREGVRAFVAKREPAWTGQ